MSVLDRLPLPALPALPQLPDMPDFLSVQGIISVAIVALLILLAITLLKRPFGCLLRLLLNALCGFFALLLIIYLGAFIGIS